MDKAQAINSFWNDFGLPAYDENTVPKDAPMPRITYSVATDQLGSVIALSASIWYRSSSWKDITLKTKEIEQRLGEHGGDVIKLDDGYAYLCKGTPFAQRMSDPDDSIRRVYINVQAEFLTPY